MEKTVFSGSRIKDKFKNIARFEDDQIIVESSDDELQMSIHELQLLSSIYL